MRAARFLSPPLRFLIGVLGLWTAMRVMLLMPGAPARLAKAADIRAEADIPARTGTFETVTPSIPKSALAPALRLAAAQAKRGSTARISAARPVEPEPLGRPDDLPPARTLMPLAAPPGIAAPPQRTSRWSGSAYLFARAGDSKGGGLATGGALGGGQAVARIAYRLNEEGPVRLALAARLSSPLRQRAGAEAAIGLDWHPLPGAPLRLSIERRVDVGGQARNAWAAYAAGGFWRALGRRYALDGYAQAGMVGARSRDGFADGAVRIGRRTMIGPDMALVLGGGAWGAVQPGVSRLDLGPRAAVSLPLAGTVATAALDWRLRVAGNARPGSGVALTLSSDF